MSKPIEIMIGQKWVVREAFGVKRPTGRFKVPKGAILEVKTKPIGGDSFYVQWEEHRFVISQENIKIKARLVTE